MAFFGTQMNAPAPSTSGLFGGAPKSTTLFGGSGGTTPTGLFGAPVTAPPAPGASGLFGALSAGSAAPTSLFG